jgi:hypothetical protein
MSQLTQTSNALEYKVLNTGGVNVVRNSDFSNGLANWEKWGNEVAILWDVCNYEGKPSLYMYNGGVNHGGFTQTISTEIGKEYTVSFMVWIHPNSYGACDIGIIGIKGINLAGHERGVWNRHSFTFTATQVQHVLLISNAADNGIAYSNIMVSNSTSAVWSKHPS